MSVQALLSLAASRGLKLRLDGDTSRSARPKAPSHLTTAARVPTSQGGAPATHLKKRSVVLLLIQRTLSIQLLHVTMLTLTARATRTM